MKSMKGVFFYLGMGSCISTKSSRKLTTNNTTNITTNNTTNITDVDNNKTVINSVQPSSWQVPGSKEEQFFDSKAWLESDDEDFVSVNGDMSPTKQVSNYKNGDHQGRRLSDLFKDSSFSRDSQTSLKAAAQTFNENEQKSAAITHKLVRKNSVKRCLPSLVRSLSCGDRKKRSTHTHVAVAG